MPVESENISAKEVLLRYLEEDLPDFACFEELAVNQKGIFGDSPLHVACVRGRVEEVDALLEGGADINMNGENGNTPLHEAAIQGHVETVRLLMKRGANADIVNDDGKTAIDVAVIGNKEAVLKFLQLQ